MRAFLAKLYRAFLAPRQQDEDLRNREVVLNLLLVATIVVLGLVLLLLLNSYRQGFVFIGGRIVGVASALALASFLYIFSRRGHYTKTAIILELIYFALAVGTAYRWGVVVPLAGALFGLVIVLAGILFGSWYSLYTAACSIVAVAVLAIAQRQGVIDPDWSWIDDLLGAGLVVGICIIFCIIAVVSWLFSNRMEHSLHRAHKAEAGLSRQKLLLETKVEERTRELQAAQIEKIQQLYRFAELGQLSTALLHELANHLATLTLDIEDLEAKNSSQMLKNAKRSIRYIDDMVVRVRDQLHGRTNVRQFSVANELDDVVTILRHRAVAAGITLHWEALSDRKNLRCQGEPIRLRQIMANLISNAIDSYGQDAEKASRREVFITSEDTDKKIIITVADWGKGIKEEDQNKIFEPFYSTKKTGMGLGLFIARQIATEHFHGSLALDEKAGHTIFVLTLSKR